jgi:NAD-dependent SIR2 family protein deacetylase
MAVTPGGYAALVGSGVSLEAGVPSGERILRDTQERLFRTQEGTDPAGPEELNKWLENSGFGDVGYSELLEAIFPAQQARRDFITSFFNDAAPGPTHVVLASLAARGLIRVFITTNFDPLLERALIARGLQPVVVSDAASLESAPARETVDVFVVKAHGDAGQLTLRNTLAELEELEPRMQSEIEEICSRHGILTLGYSGRDPAIGKALRRTSTRFGLYWGARSSPVAPEAADIVAAASGRLVVRPSAQALVTELEDRVGQWLAHPTGQTPTSVRAEMITRLRAGDRVGVSELARAERLHFETETFELISEAAEKFGPYDPIQAELKSLEADLAALLERKLASGFVLVEHSAGFAEEVEWLAQLASRELPVKGSYPGWVQAPRRLIWMLLWAYGAFACARRRFGAIRTMWEIQEPTVEATPIAALRQLGGHTFGTWLEFARYGKQMSLEGLWHIAFILAGSDLVRDHYPELLRDETGDNALGILGSLGDYSYFLAALAGRDSVEVPHYWAVGGQLHLSLALLMERDRRLQGQLMDLFEPEPGEEDQIAKHILAWRRMAPGAPE